MRTRLTRPIVTTAILAATGNVFGQVAGRTDSAGWDRLTLWYAQVRRLLFEGKNAEATKLTGEKMMGRPRNRVIELKTQLGQSYTLSAGN